MGKERMTYNAKKTLPSVTKAIKSGETDSSSRSFFNVMLPFKDLCVCNSFHNVSPKKTTVREVSSGAR